MAELSPEVYRRVLESLPAGICVVDSNRRISLWNDGAEKLTGYSRNEMIGREGSDDLRMCEINGQPGELDVFMRHKDGRRIPVRVRAIPIRDEHGAIIGTAEYMDERAVFPIALDAAAEVADHQAIVARLLAGLEDFASGQVPFGVLSIAIDGPDRLRHRYGHQAVNAVWRVTARILSRNLGPGSLIGCGSSGSHDRFTAIVGNSTAGALLKTAGLLKRLASLEAIPWWGDRISVTLSIGGTMARAGDTPESLLERADRALGASLLEYGDQIVVA